MLRGVQRVESRAIDDVAFEPLLASPAPPEAPEAQLDRTLTDHEAVDRFRRLSVGLIVASIAISVVLALGLEIPSSADGTAMLAMALSAMLLTSSLLCKPSGVKRVVADACGTLAVSVLAGIAGSGLAVLGLRLHLPMADAALRSADLRLGFDAVAIVRAMSMQQPWFFRLMSWGYHYTLPTIAVSLLILSLFNRKEAWRVALCFTGSLMTICLIAVFVPAKGIGMWTPDAVLAHLPGCSMRCFWPTFDIFYAKPDAVLALKNIDGVISFPSFHAAMGCIVLAAWRINMVTAFLATIWFVFLMMGTLPYGGHYGVDLIAGCLVWYAWFALSKKLEGGRPRILEGQWRARQESNLRPHA